MSQTGNISDAQLSAIVQEANPAILLASLVATTGDTSRIAEFTPLITHQITASGITSQLPPEAAARLARWAAEVLNSRTAGREAGAEELEDDVFRELLEAIIGWPIPVESLPFLREQGGFVSFVPTVPRTREVREDFKLAIIGAGMSGIAMAVAARRAGLTFELLEKNEGLGGVWWQNRYPGVGVDTPSKYYSFSFEINPEWTHAFPEGDQYLRYLERVADKYSVTSQITFGAEVTDLAWDDATSRWRITYRKDGQAIDTDASVVVTAAGYLTRPKLPDVPGIETFEGEWFHSAEWNQEYDFDGKRIAVVGTGCTSVQVVDALAQRVASLTLFQRQPHWVAPGTKTTGELPASERWLLANVPTYAAWARLHTFLPISDANYESVRYDPQWAAEHDLSISARNDMFMQLALSHLRGSFGDRPDLLAKMKPDYAPMGKRPVRDPGHFYESLKKDTSRVVTAGLKEVTPRGIIDDDGMLHELDAVIYATGFTLEYLSHWTIIGRGGRKLADAWRERPMAYLGCQVPGFPNLFITSGPNASAAHGAGHNFTVEAMVHYVMECIQTLAETDSAAMDVTEGALSRWQEEVDAVLADSVWCRDPRATTYYRNTRGHVVLPSPIKMEDYWNRLRRPDLADIELTPAARLPIEGWPGSQRNHASVAVEVRLQSGTSAPSSASRRVLQMSFSLIRLIHEV